MLPGALTRELIPPKMISIYVLDMCANVGLSKRLATSSIFLGAREISGTAEHVELYMQPDTLPKCISMHMFESTYRSRGTACYIFYIIQI